MVFTKNSGAMSNSNRPDWRFYDSILEKEDIRPFIDCMTCGKCVGDCIAAKNSEFNARKIVQKIIMHSSPISLCSSSQTELFSSKTCLGLYNYTF